MHVCVENLQLKQIWTFISYFQFLGSFFVMEPEVRPIRIPQIRTKILGPKDSTNWQQ